MNFTFIWLENLNLWYTGLGLVGGVVCFFGFFGFEGLFLKKKILIVNFFLLGKILVCLDIMDCWLNGDGAKHSGACRLSSFLTSELILVFQLEVLARWYSSP